MKNTMRIAALALLISVSATACRGYNNNSAADSVKADSAKADSTKIVKDTLK